MLNNYSHLSSLYEKEMVQRSFVFSITTAATRLAMGTTHSLESRSFWEKANAFTLHTSHVFKYPATYIAS